VGNTHSSVRLETHTRECARAYRRVSCNVAGFATTAFETHEKQSTDGVGDDTSSWAFDGQRTRKWHGNGTQLNWDVTWSKGDIIGLAANLASGQILASKNGRWLGSGFIGEAIAAGVYPAVTAGDGMTVRWQIAQPFAHSPPSVDVWEAKAELEKHEAAAAQQAADREAKLRAESADREEKLKAESRRRDTTQKLAVTQLQKELRASRALEEEAVGASEAPEQREADAMCAYAIEELEARRQEVEGVRDGSLISADAGLEAKLSELEGQVTKARAALEELRAGQPRPTVGDRVLIIDSARLHAAGVGGAG
jgi:hypothetical protein